jgi:hypothetical protein
MFSDASLTTDQAPADHGPTIERAFGGFDAASLPALSTRIAETGSDRRWPREEATPMTGGMPGETT